jgi:hypothetical protein
MRRAVTCGSKLRAILVVTPILFIFVCLGGTTFAQQVGARPGGVPHVNAPIFLRQPIRTVRPIFLYRTTPRLGFWGRPLYSYGLGFGYGPAWWSNCGPYWRWGSSCYVYTVPVYISSGGGRDLPQLYMKDGTVYNVTDYWSVDNQLHFTTIDESGTKWDEHTVGLDQLDLQKTVDVSKQRGFRFLLRNEPLQQYLQDHPEIGTQPQ